MDKSKDKIERFKEAINPFRIHLLLASIVCILIACFPFLCNEEEKIVAKEGTLIGYKEAYHDFDGNTMAYKVTYVSKVDGTIQTDYCRVSNNKMKHYTQDDIDKEFTFYVEGGGVSTDVLSKIFDLFIFLIFCYYLVVVIGAYLEVYHGCGFVYDIL